MQLQKAQAEIEARRAVGLVEKAGEGGAEVPKAIQDAADLAGKPQTIVLNKIDALPPETVQEWERTFIGEVERLRGKSVCDDALRERAAVVSSSGRHWIRVGRVVRVPGVAPDRLHADPVDR